MPSHRPSQRYRSFIISVCQNDNSNILCELIIQISHPIALIRPPPLKFVIGLCLAVTIYCQLKLMNSTWSPTMKTNKNWRKKKTKKFRHSSIQCMWKTQVAWLTHDDTEHSLSIVIANSDSGRNNNSFWMRNARMIYAKGTDEGTEQRNYKTKTKFMY